MCVGVCVRGWVWVNEKEKEFDLKDYCLVPKSEVIFVTMSFSTSFGNVFDTTVLFPFIFFLSLISLCHGGFCYRVCD